MVPSNSPKTWKNEFVVVGNTNLFVRFLEAFEDTKSPFEIIWPLAITLFYSGFRAVLCMLDLELWTETFITTYLEDQLLNETCYLPIYHGALCQNECAIPIQYTYISLIARYLGLQFCFNMQENMIFSKSQLNQFKSLGRAWSEGLFLFWKKHSTV